jgi:NAD(P) transhydrogenase subunit alpha
MADQKHILTETATEMANTASQLAEQAAQLALQAGETLAMAEGGSASGSFLIMGLTVFVLACFVGYYVVWNVTPALHSPLMGVTNAISSVIIVGAIIALGSAESGFSQFMGFLGVILASINIFGGFIVSRRMLSMFKKKG